MHLLNTIASKYLSSRQSSIDHWLQSPIEAQKQVFKELVHKAKNTAWGKDHDYQHISSIADFKKRVSIQDYDSLKPYITRTMAGEQNVLWSQPIQWFAKSSGTTSDKSKFIPVSKDALKNCHFKGGMDSMTMYCHTHPKTQVYTGKAIIMGGSHSISELNQHSKYGDLSAVLMQNMPYFAKFLNEPKLSIALQDNWELKLEQIAQSTVHQNITHLAGVPTWTILLIKRLLEITGKNHLLEVWPNFELYIHGGVSFTPYREQFAALIPPNKTQYWQTYNASEGFFAVQDAPNRDDMLLMLKHGIFYEFMPMEELDKANPQTLQLQEVEVGKNYALIISTNSGLWRYRIGDTIHFTTLSPHRIKVSGRTRHFINAFGEEVIIDNSDQAIHKACEQTGAKVQEYTAAPVYFSGDENGTHEWLIEFDEAPADLLQFATILDQELQKLNSDYEAKRFKGMAMRFPLVQSVPKGTFYQWLKNRGKLGGQHKIPRLANHREYLEDIKQLLVD
ncbi:MAG: GH3 auxin-responsive promoter family protein [Chitinophagales bacterium]